ncbi:NAD-dependent epimerase/dehydratase family protein [Microbacterium sp. NPDC055903]
MTDVLILGGTGWLSGRVARGWLDRGARVVCLARGTRPTPPGTELVVGDRDDPDVYARVQGPWDEVVDVSSRAGHVRGAVEALGADGARWTYVSSVSVYSDGATVGADESAPVEDPALDDDADYAAQKVAAERAVLSGAAGGVRIVRPGLVVGEGDPSDRFGYWAAAFARAGADAVLVPTTENRWVQVIDVDDLAAFIVADRGTGILDAVGEPTPLGAVLDAFGAAASHTGRVVAAEDAWLEEHGVDYWMGRPSLPLWLPADLPGFARRSTLAFRAAGGSARPLERTIAAVLADERGRGLDRDRRAGLSRTEEERLLAELGA